MKGRHARENSKERYVHARKNGGVLRAVAACSGASMSYRSNQVCSEDERPCGCAGTMTSHTKATRIR